jgi:oxygen-dependent protoporphyrinogen oxidase
MSAGDGGTPDENRAARAQDVDSVVVGAGISGLTAAYYLSKARGSGAEGSLAVLEAGSGPGGKMISVHQDGFLCEFGPNSLRGSRPHLWELIDELGLTERVVRAAPAAKKRYILKRGRLEALPAGPGQVLRSSLLSARGKLRLLSELLVPRGHRHEESVAAFVSRRFGREPLRFAVDPFVAGIYAGDSAELSAQAAFPQLTGLERRYRSVLAGMLRAARGARAARKPRSGRGGGDAPPPRGQFTFAGGVAELPRALAERLGSRVRYNAAVDRVVPEAGRWRVAFRRHGGETEELRAGRVILAVPAYAAARLLEGSLGTQAVEPLDAIPYPPVLSINVAYRRSAVGRPLDGFGFLTPKGEEPSLLGAIWASTVFPSRSDEAHALFTVFVGGARDRARVEASAGGGRDRASEDAAQRSLDALERILRIREKPAFVDALHWQHAIPQYTLGHRERLTQLDELEANHPGLHFLGNYRDGVSVPDCVEAARRRITTLRDD